MVLLWARMVAPLLRDYALHVVMVRRMVRALGSDVLGEHGLLQASTTLYVLLMRRGGCSELVFFGCIFGATQSCTLCVVHGMHA